MSVPPKFQASDDVDELVASWLEVVQIIRREPMAVDMSLSFFAAALKSYRWDSIIKPFPPMFAGHDPDEDHDVEGLRQVFNSIPPLQQLVTTGAEFAGREENRRVVQLLSWIFQKRHNHVVACPKSEFKEICSRVGSPMKIQPTDCPDYILRVRHKSVGQASSALRQTSSTEEPTSNTSDSSAAEAPVVPNGFDDYVQRYGSFLAFHGSRAENFYSILHAGLIAHYNQQSLYGYGTYLSDTLSMAVNYCGTGSTWQHSVAGRKMTCIAVCEVADKPKQVRRSDTDPNASPSKPSAVPGTDSELRRRLNKNDAVPDNYIVVSNDDLIRLRYILVFSQRRANDSQSDKLEDSWLRAFYRRHVFTIILVGYTIVMVTVGLLYRMR